MTLGYLVYNMMMEPTWQELAGRLQASRRLCSFIQYVYTNSIQLHAAMTTDGLHRICENTNNATSVENNIQEKAYELLLTLRVGGGNILDNRVDDAAMQYLADKHNDRYKQLNKAILHTLHYMDIHRYMDSVPGRDNIVRSNFRDIINK
jgi:hypothetical protein